MVHNQFIRWWRGQGRSRRGGGGRGERVGGGGERSGWFKDIREKSRRGKMQVQVHCKSCVITTLVTHVPSGTIVSRASKTICSTSEHDGSSA